MKKGETVAEYRGWSWCRFGCLEANGSADKTDGTYIFPEGLVHYIDQHPFYIFLELISQIRRIATLIENIKQAGIKCRRYGTWALVQPYGF